MSLRSFNKFCRIFQSPAELKYVEKLCIHCSASHRQQKDQGQDVKTAVPATLSNEERIGRAMRVYLEKKKASDAVIKSHIQEYELGKRHLANIMGTDPDDFTQRDINAAIAYLLPSGLFNKKARPMFKHPFEILPKLFAARFDATGRPQHFLFYTVKQAYHELMHNIAWKIEDLKTAEDESAKKSIFDFEAHMDEKLNLLGSVWVSQSVLEKKINEKISENEYKRFCKIMDHLVAQTFSKKEEAFIMKFRRFIRSQSESANIPELKTDDEGRKYMTAFGYRKSAKAFVKVYGNGTGEISINGRDISYFDELVHRQQVLFPMQFSGTLGIVDVVAYVKEGGPTGQSGAIRLGLSKALVSFVGKDMMEKMRLAGLLTRDPRVRERKKPGQLKARKKFTWKKR